MKTPSEILHAQLDELLANFDIKGLLHHSASHLLLSGAIDKDGLKEDNKMVAKCIFHCILSTASKQYIPLSPEGKKELKNIQHFI